MDTDSLISSRFYTYAKLAISSGINNAIEFFAFDIIILASVFLDYASMTSNVIILNYLATMWIFPLGVAGILTKRIAKYYSDVKKDVNYLFIKFDIIIGSVLAITFSVLTFLFAYVIPGIYVDDKVVIDNVGYVLKWYSVFIFFDFSYMIINGAIKGIQKHSMINIVCSLIIIFIFIPLGLLFTFAFSYGYLGFWMSTFISMVFFSLLLGGYFIYLLDEILERKDDSLTTPLITIETLDK